MNEKSKSPVVLIIDDENQMRRLLRLALEGDGYRVFEAATGREGLLEAARCRPDAVILDLGLPDMKGMTTLERLREWSQVPVLILSVRDREEEKIAALDHGADDYVTKPFGTGELLARLRAAQRRSKPWSEESVFRSGGLEVDLARRVVSLKGREIKLTATEYALLKLLVHHAGKVLTHRQLLQGVWGPHSVEHTHYLRVYIAHLREKLEADPSHPKLLVTDSGIGYRMMIL